MPKPEKPKFTEGTIGHPSHGSSFIATSVWIRLRTKIWRGPFRWAIRLSRSNFHGFLKESSWQKDLRHCLSCYGYPPLHAKIKSKFKLNVLSFKCSHFKTRIKCNCFSNNLAHCFSFYLASLYRNKESLSLAKDLTLTLHFICNKAYQSTTPQHGGAGNKKYDNSSQWAE